MAGAAGAGIRTVTVDGPGCRFAGLWYHMLSWHTGVQQHLRQPEVVLVCRQGRQQTECSKARPGVFPRPAAPSSRQCATQHSASF